MWNVFIDIAPLKYDIGIVLASKTQGFSNETGMSVHLAHLQSRLLLGCDVLLLGMIPEVLIKRGSRERDATMGISVIWLVKVVETS